MIDQEFQSHRLILAYHGCEKSVADKVLLDGDHLQHSENEYDWLGKGIYFWEHGPNRALEWAKRNKEIKEPAVVGAVINLGDCFDLFDRYSIQTLAAFFPEFVASYKSLGKDLPVNESGFKDDQDNLKRHRDCAVINWSLEMLEQSGRSHDSVRGLFQEGGAVFEGSSIMAKSHIQIAIRNTACILGYFRPT